MAGKPVGKSRFGNKSVYAIDLETNSYKNKKDIPLDWGTPSFIQSWSICKKYVPHRDLSQYIVKMSKDNKIVITKDKEKDKIKDIDKFTYLSGWSQSSLIEVITNFDRSVIFYFANGAKYDNKYIQGMLLKDERFTDITGLPRLNINITYKTTEQELLIYLEENKLTDLFFKRYDKWEKAELKIGSVKFTNKLVWFAKVWNMTLPWEFSYLIKDGKTYKIKLAIEHEKNKGRERALKIEFRDFYLLFPPMQSLAKTGQTLNKIYNTNVFTKLPESYINRTFKDKDDFINRDNGDHFKYVNTDTKILFQYIIESTKVIPFTQWKLTIASTAINQLYKTISKTWLKNNPDKYDYNEPLQKVTKKGKKWGCSIEQFGKQYMKSIFQLERYDKDIEEYINPESDNYGINKNVNQDMNKKYYFGGITYVNEKHRYTLQKSFGADISSSYPTQMMRKVVLPKGLIKQPALKDKDNPFSDLTSEGHGTISYKDSQHRLFYCIVTKKFGSNKVFPFIRTTGVKGKVTYRTHFKAGDYFYCTSTDMKELLKRYSNINIHYTLEYAFWNDETTFYDLFNEYLTTWYGNKQKFASEGNDVLKKISKLFCNSIYGKFGSKVEQKIITYDIDGIVRETITIEPTKFPLILAIIITDMARLQLAEGCNNFHNDLIYTDTDSMTFVYKNKNQHDKIIKTLHSPLDPSTLTEPTKNLGQWDIEQDGWWMLPRRTKQYFKISPDLSKVKFVFAGINMDKLIKSNGKYLDAKALLKKTSFYKLMHGTTFNQTISRMYYDHVNIKKQNKIIYQCNDYEHYQPLQEQDINRLVNWTEFRKFDRKIRRSDQ